jgi:cytoskeletal protein RodZ
MAEKLHYDASGSTFKEAFKDAREDGKKTFEWNGKKYTTDVATPKAKEKAEEPKSESKEEPAKEDKRGRGVPAALGAAAVGLGGAALLSGMKRSEEQRKEHEMAKASGKSERASPVRNISPEESAWEGEGGRSYRKGGKAKAYAKGGSASSRGDGCAMRGKTKGRMV